MDIFGIILIVGAMASVLAVSIAISGGVSYFLIRKVRDSSQAIAEQQNENAINLAKMTGSAMSETRKLSDRVAALEEKLGILSMAEGELKEVSKEKVGIRAKS